MSCYKPTWGEVTRNELRKMSDDDVRELYRQMCEDQGCQYTMDAAGNMLVVTTEQKRMVGNNFRGRGLK